MAWKRTDPMEERIRFVMETRSGVFRMSELSERYGVSRKTGYKWLQRYREGGLGHYRIGAGLPTSARIVLRKRFVKH